MRQVTIPDCLLAASRTVPAAIGAVLLSACAAWTPGEVPPRTSVTLFEPSSMGRPEWLQRLVAAVDSEAFPYPEGLRLKLSYQLFPVSPQAARKSAQDPADS